jgi:hypothetical protein
MDLAEKKIQLLEIVVNADEEMTGKLIEFANTLTKREEKFAKEELEKFHASRQSYLTNPEHSLTLEEAHTYIRSLKKR